MRPARHRAAVRVRQTVAAVRYLPRIGRWSVLSGAMVLGTGLLLWTSTRAGWGVGPALSSLRLAGVMLCAAAVFTLDDPAADTTAASPLPLHHRRGASFLLAMATVGVLWSGLVGLASLLLTEGIADACLALVRGPLTSELLWLVAVGVAVATVTARRLGATAGGIAAGPAVVLLYAGVHQLPASWTLIAGGPLDAVWAPAHRRLVVLAVVAAVIALWAVRDPWQPAFLERARRGLLPAIGAASVLAAVVAVAVLPGRAPTTTERLDATLDDLVASQGIEQLAVVVADGDLRWSRTVGDPATALPVGRLSIAELHDTVVSAEAAVGGTATVGEMVTWMRQLASTDAALEDRLAASSPPAGTTWIRTAADQPPPAPSSELRYVAASGTVVATMTGAATAPCGAAVADALTATLRGRG